VSHKDAVRFVLATLLLGLTACDFRVPSDPRKQPLLPRAAGDEANEDFGSCIQRNKRAWRKCAEFEAPRRMRGVWYTGFEESGFVPNVDRVPMRRDVLKDPTPEFHTTLLANDDPMLESISRRATGRAMVVAIDFVGGRSIEVTKIPNGGKYSMVIVDRVRSARVLGEVQSCLKLPGRTEKCD
jgi:hypothetical protein